MGEQETRAAAAYPSRRIDPRFGPEHVYFDEREIERTAFSRGWKARSQVTATMVKRAELAVHAYYCGEDADHPLSMCDVSISQPALRAMLKAALGN